jgi:hypothetical protein
MPLTNAEKQARARAKRAAKLERYEAALREIADGGQSARLIARQALGDTAGMIRLNGGQG